MGDMDAEDTKSLDSNEGAAVGAEENHSSNSDIIHLEREEAEMLEEAAVEERAAGAGAGVKEEEIEEEEMQMSVMSVLGSEKELVELRQEEEEEEEEDEEELDEPGLHAPETEELLVTVEEEPYEERESVEFRQVVPPMALPPLPIVRLDPPSAISTPVTATTISHPEDLPSQQGLHPPCILAPPPAEPESVEPPSQIPLTDKEEHSGKDVEITEAALLHGKVMSSTEMLCGGAALVAVVGIVAYGAVTYCRK